MVKENSPASLQYGRGRMVGYGEEAQDTLRYIETLIIDKVNTLTPNKVRFFLSN